MTTRIAVPIEEAAEMVGVTDKVLRKAIHAGNLRAKRQSTNSAGEGVGKYLISVKALEDWYEGLVDA